MVLVVKNLPTNVGDTGDAVLIPRWRRSLEEEMASHSSILPGKSHEQRSLAGYSPWDHKESDMTEQLNNNSIDRLGSALEQEGVGTSLMRKEERGEC